MICNEKSRSLASDDTFNQDIIGTVQHWTLSLRIHTHISPPTDTVELGDSVPTLSRWELMQYFLILNWQLYNALRIYMVCENWAGWAGVAFTDKAAVVLGVAQLPLTALILLELIDMWRDRRVERQMRSRLEAQERVSKC